MAAMLALPLLSGCVSLVVPLCPKVAAASYPAEHAPSPVNRYLLEAARQWKVEVTVLSPFAAELYGARRNVARMEANYRFLLCSFDPANVANVEAAYMTCIAHAPTWMAAVKSGTPQHLMLEESLYRARCVPTGTTDKTE